MQQLNLQQRRALVLSRQDASIAWRNSCFSRLQVGCGANALQHLHTPSIGNMQHGPVGSLGCLVCSSHAERLPNAVWLDDVQPQLQLAQLSMLCRASCPWQGHCTTHQGTVCNACCSIHQTPPLHCPTAGGADGTAMAQELRQHLLSMVSYKVDTFSPTAAAGRSSVAWVSWSGDRLQLGLSGCGCTGAGHQHAGSCC